MSSETKTPLWQDQLYESLRRNGVTLFAYVPDAGHATLIEHSAQDPEVISVPLTTEEEASAFWPEPTWETNVAFC